ncbi:MAG: (Fe-S)-binding protein [Cytophagaceae bacterium]|nr:(Fe-S)-binding protein [Cytophagaceae bacterium]MDW8455658.1 (Fe-S)-binding protein [Cytophagaceae bacterium]
MNGFARLFFLACLTTAIYFIAKRIMRIRRNILLGRRVRTDGPHSARLKNMLLVALGQKKMFKKPIPAILHLFIYTGFLIVNIEMLEIVIDGIAGTHRIFAPYMGSTYSWLINVFEFFALAVIISCIIFLIRRNVLHLSRFSGTEMTRKPLLDANIILVAEILLMIAFLSMNAADMVLQNRGMEHYVKTSGFILSGTIAPMFSEVGNGTLQIIERFCWWFHILGVFLFANYVFGNSKHLHIFLAFPNTWYSRLQPAGSIHNIPAVTREVQSMLGLASENAPQENNDTARFGAKDVTDLTWINILNAYSCTECGRCTQQCPANITGKKLSPRKIMMDVRNRAEEVGKNIALHGKDYDDGKSLLGHYITDEEILACTTCNACVEACPVNINPVEIIIQLRQYNILEQSKAPQSWNMMFSNIENNGAPWKFPQSDRAQWMEKV